MILTLFYVGYPPMFGFYDFGIINALAAADILDASNPLLNFAAIDDSVGGLNIVPLTDNAPGGGRDEAAFLLYLSVDK